MPYRRELSPVLAPLTRSLDTFICGIILSDLASFRRCMTEIRRKRLREITICCPIYLNLNFYVLAVTRYAKR